MFHTKSQLIGPLCQPNKTSISFNIIEGSANIKLYRKNGDLKKVFKLASSNKSKPTFLRLDAREYRSIKSTSKHLIFIETCSGPFEDNDTFWLSK